jgi:putative zinc finger/helix-turn-helix YgiT family protein
MKCHECNKDMKEAKENYFYKESGLNNVVLENISVYRCECGEYLASIPAIIGLNSIIALNLIKKKTFLKGEEIKYLRKNAGLNAKLFAEYIGVDKSTLSRWENNKQSIDKSNDRLIRFVYANIKGVSPEEIKNLLDDVIKKINNFGEEVEINIPVGCFSTQEVECGLC